MNTSRPPVDATTGSLTARAAAAFRSYRGGDANAMQTLVETATPALWHVARGCGLSRPAAEDVVQNTWLKLVEHAEGISEPQAVLCWLCTTARRDAWRLSRETGRAVPLPETPETVDGDSLGPSRQASTPDPEALAVDLDQARRLWEHFARLSPKCRRILRAICLGGPPDYAALAQAMGIPIGSIGPTRGRCLAALRRYLEADPHWSLT